MSPRSTFSRFSRPAKSKRTKQLILIGTEGCVTEPTYFDAFKIRSRDVPVHIEICPSRASNPLGVLKTLQRKMRDRNFKKGDEAWLVLDHDSWSESERKQAVKKTKDAGIKLIVSNPCFELWLYLHFEDYCLFSTPAELHRKVEQKMASNPKEELDTNILIPRIAKAIQRAKRVDMTNPGEWPAEPITQVYRLVEKLPKPTVPD